MTLTEKLNLISDLEEAKLNSVTINAIVESLEHPEKNSGPFKTIDEFWAHIDSVEDDEVADAKN